MKDEIVEDDEVIDDSNDPEKTEEVPDSDDFNDSDDSSLSNDELKIEESTYQLTGEEEVIKDGIFKEPKHDEISEEKLLEFLHFKDHQVKSPQRVKNR